MMTKRSLYFIPCLFFISLQSVVNAQKNPGDTLASKIEWTGYVDSSSKFKVRLPSDWKQQPTDEQLRLVLYSPREGKADRYLENINLLVVKEDKGTKITKAFKKDVEKELKATVEDFVIESQRDLTWNGSPAWEIVYTEQLKKPEILIRRKARFTIANNISYVFTYAYEGNKTDNHANTSEVILNSIEFLK